MTTEELKEDIIERYNMSWSKEDEYGLVKACKDNFRNLINQLIKSVRDEKEPSEIKQKEEE